MNEETKNKETGDQEEVQEKENCIKRCFRKTKEFVKANAKKIAGGVVAVAFVAGAVFYGLAAAKRSGDDVVFDPDEGPEPGDDYEVQDDIPDDIEE